MSESLSQKTFKNALWQVFNLGWMTILNFFVTPILLQKFGIENYGVYVLILTIINFLSLLEFGMGAGFIKSFTELTAQDNPEKRDKLVNSFFVFWLLAGLAGALILSAGADFLIGWFNLSGENLRLAFYFAGGYFIFSMVGSLFASLATAMQRFDIVGKAIFFQSTLLNAGLLWLAFYQPRPFSFFLGHFSVAALSLLFYFFLIRKALPDLRLKAVFDFKIFKSTFSFSFFNFLHGIANNLLFQVDRFFISRFLSPVYLPFYVIPNNLAQKIHSVSNAGAGTLFPVASTLSFTGDSSRLVSAYRRAMRMVLIFAIFSGFILWSFGYQLLFYWIGQEMADKSGPLLTYFALTYVLLSVFSVLGNFFIFVSGPKSLAKFSWLMALLNITFLFIFLPRFGIFGAGLAYFLSVLPVFPLILFFEKKKLNLKNSLGFYGKLLLKLGLVCGLFSLFIRPIASGYLNGIFPVLVSMGFGLVILFVLFWIFNFFEKEEKDLIINLLLQRGAKK